MRRVILCLAGLLSLSPVARAQSGADARQLLTDLGPISQAADALLRYDRVAWITSDSVTALPPTALAGLGPEWFCDTIDGAWHAFYGRYDAQRDAYAIAFHYRVTQDGIPRSVATPVDTSRVLSFARALFNTRTRLPVTFLNAGVRFNWYVQAPATGGILVSVIPAFQPNGFLVFGGEVHYLWNPAGRVLTDSTYYFARFRGVRPDSTLDVVIPADDVDLPTVGQLFFLFSNHRYFRHLTIRTRRAATSLFVGEDGKPALITVPRDTLAAVRPS